MTNTLIYVVAAAGIPNYGDELILASWLRHLLGQRPDLQIVVDCIDPVIAAALQDEMRVSFVNYLWRCLWSGPDNLNEMQGWLSHVDGLPDRFFPLQLLDRLFMGAEVTILFVGGGYLGGLWPRHINFLAIAVYLKKRWGCRLFASGQGLSPQPLSLVPELHRLAAEFEVFDVRDPVSQSLTGGTYSGDDMIFFGDRTSSVSPRGDCIHLSIQNDSNGDNRAIETIADWMTTLSLLWGRELGKQVRFLEMLPGDLNSCRHLLPQEVEFVPFLSLWRDGLGIAPDDLCLTTRFHLHLLGGLAGAVGIAAYGNDYYVTKHRNAAALTGWPLFDIAQLPPVESVPIPEPRVIAHPLETQASYQAKAAVIHQISLGLGAIPS